MKIDDPGADLAVCLALLSSAEQRPLRERYCAFGEVSLLGTVRPATQSERRRKEAERLGLVAFEGGDGALGPLLAACLVPEQLVAPAAA